MREISLNVCQGVGDIFWVYQKFSSYADRINFYICQVPGSNVTKVQTRAVDFIRLLPKTRNILFRESNHSHYTSLFSNHWPIEPLIRQIDKGSHDVFDYSVNYSLENGVRIEDIDPGSKVEFTVPVRTVPVDGLPASYITVYVSGTTTNAKHRQNLNLWTCEKWAECVEKLYEKYDLDIPVMLIGAGYDKPAAEDVKVRLDAKGFKTQLHIDLPAAQAAHIIKETDCFLGYQSGLSILADNFNRRQIMLYFPYLDKMHNAWANVANIESGKYNPFSFKSSPDDVVSTTRFSF